MKDRSVEGDEVPAEGRRHQLSAADDAASDAQSKSNFTEERVPAKPGDAKRPAAN